MTGLEITLIIIGIVIVIASFLFGEHIDGKNENITAAVDEETIKATVQEKVDDAVESKIDDTVEKTAQELDKLSNEKIMAVSDYSENVLNEINKSHEEVMFLYSMLNDKEEEIKNTVKDVEMVKASVKQMTQERETEQKEAVKNEKISDTTAIDDGGINEIPEKTESKEQISEPFERKNNNQKILDLYKSGMDTIDIAKNLNLGMGEVRLVIDLYKNRTH